MYQTEFTSIMPGIEPIRPALNWPLAVISGSVLVGAIVLLILRLHH